MLVTIYSIVCKTNPELIYVGSTQDYKKRVWTHSSASKENPKKVYELIRSNGGWDNFVMSPIKIFECDTREQGREEEDKYIVEMKATMNTIRATFDIKRKQEYDRKYIGENKEKIKEYRDEYRKENADKIHADAKRYYQEHKEERKAYRESIAEEQKEYKKKWYEEHKEERQKKNKEEYTCACGKVGRVVNKVRHEKTKFHLDFIQRQ